MVAVREAPTKLGRCSVKRVAIIQARMQSRRLPGKVLMPIAGRPMLEHQLRRVARCGSIDATVLATTDRPADDDIAELGRRLDVAVVRGSNEDVLDRFRRATEQHAADIVVRLTADCPLIDPEVIDAVVDRLASDHAFDYASNVLTRTYPHGLDTEAMHADVVVRLSRLATSGSDREHVTSYLRFTHPELFRVISVTDVADSSDLRWTVDTTEDLRLVRLLFERLNLSEVPLGYREIVALMRADPSLSSVNQEAAVAYPPDAGFSDRRIEGSR